MTSPKDFDKVIQERLKSLGKKYKKPENDPEDLESTDEEIGKGEAVKKSQKAKKKRMNGYINKTGRTKA